MLTIEQLNTVFDYDPATGMFRRKPKSGRTAHNAKVGQWVVGTINRSGYAVLNVLDNVHYCHRLAWLAVHEYMPSRKLDIDHIDGDKANNRIENLRLATRSQNNMNRERRTKALSGHYGVVRAGNAWMARIQVRGAVVRVRCQTAEEAVKAREQLERQHQGDFRRPG